MGRRNGPAISAVGLQTGYAQEAQQQPLEEVVVTGSRIVRRDYEANSPLQTVDRSASVCPQGSKRCSALV